MCMTVQRLDRAAMRAFEQPGCTAAAQRAVRCHATAAVEGRISPHFNTQIQLHDMESTAAQGGARPRCGQQLRTAIVKGLGLGESRQGIHRRPAGAAANKGEDAYEQTRKEISKREDKEAIY